MTAEPRCAVGVPTSGPFGDPLLLVELAVAAEEHGWDGFLSGTISCGAIPGGCRGSRFPGCRPAAQHVLPEPLLAGGDEIGADCLLECHDEPGADGLDDGGGAAFLARDRVVEDRFDPDGQLWARAMADTLIDANAAATAARGAGQARLDDTQLAAIRARYRGAVAKGITDNQRKRTEIGKDGLRLARRFRDHEDMILRFTTDLAVGFTSNQAERDVRPVKVQMRTSGGCWRTLQGLADFAIVQSYLSTAGKWASTPSTRSPSYSPASPGSRPQQRPRKPPQPRTSSRRSPGPRKAHAGARCAGTHIPAPRSQ